MKRLIERHSMSGESNASQLGEIYSSLAMHLLTFKSHIRAAGERTSAEEKQLQIWEVYGSL